MKNVVIYVTGMLCLFVTNLFAQEPTFEQRARTIAEKIESITKEEKSALKQEVESINKQIEEGVLSLEQGDEQKLILAQSRAGNIERRTAAAQDELRRLIQDKVEGTVRTADTTKAKGIQISYKWNNPKKDTVLRSESRTTSQFLLALGLNHLLTDGAMAHSDYKVWGSHFYEIGLTWNTRVLKNHNLLHLRYGASLQYNNLRPTDNRYFVKDGQQTLLETATSDLKESRLRNLNLVVPVHLEFDFSPRLLRGDRKIFKTHENVRIGLGGYVGGNLKTKNHLRFYDENGYRVKQQIKGDYNVNDFIYGLSAYIGYGEISLYAKYDLNPMFEHNTIKQNNLSFGVRFDLH